MASLSEITLAHSRRISAITRIREEGFRRVTAERDDLTRAMPAAARLYEKFDEQITEARGRQVAIDEKAAASRALALQSAADGRGTGVDAAHRRRTDADVAAFAQKKKSEDAAEKKFLDALAANPSKPIGDAQRARAAELERLKQEFSDALRAAQDRFRSEVDAALIEERRVGREAERAFQDAARIGESSSRAARSTAEQALLKGLSLVPDASAVIERWRTATARVIADFRRAEDEEMSRFHDDMQRLRT
ncbi:MAG: hypothetical protein ABI039_03860 [Vicinamibacterales bacterium]